MVSDLGALWRAAMVSGTAADWAKVVNALDEHRQRASDATQCAATAEQLEILGELEREAWAAYVPAAEFVIEMSEVHGPVAGGE